jgi:serine/threonine protein kinase
MINEQQIHFQQLREKISEKTNDIVVWCGAGLSAGAGLPGWSELKSNILKDSENELEIDETTIKKLDSIKKQSDFWVSFSMLKELLGTSKYQALIKKYLDLHSRAPEIYEKIWEFNPKGIITVNIDRFAGTSFSNVYPGKRVNEFEGFSIKDNYRLLRTPDNFIVNIHGNIDKPSTWVFTKEELSALQKTDGYTEFLTTIFSSNTVLFIGISVDDVAVGGLINNLVNEKHIEMENHYWITDRNDNETKKWADLSHVNIIKYTAGKHEEVVEYIDNILEFISKDKDATPIIMDSVLPASIINQNELIGKPANQIRYLLNSHANAILGCNNNEPDYEKYFHFLDEFDQEIHSAWYVGLRKPRNEIFNYQITKNIGSGGFGTVYEAEKDGEKYAIKILHQDIRYQEAKLKSFRRGVRSLKILAKRNIGGIVRLFEATEIPSMIVMELIDGINLKNFVEMHYCTDWDIILEISYNLVKIISTTHGVPERVLHRDLKPTNIFLERYFDNNSVNLTITDFDFSWHKDALEGDIPRNPTGYISPEQVSISNKESTRSSLVDSYSIGMIFYYMVSGEEPLFKSHLMKDWEKKIVTSCKSIKCDTWRSIPIRYSRMIESLTKNKQKERLNVNQSVFELERLMEYCHRPSGKYSELLAEELIYRIVGSEDYSIERYTFGHKFVSGITMNIVFSETTNEISLIFSYAPTGQESRKNIKKYIPDKYKKIEAKLVSTLWKVTILTASNKGLVLNATINPMVLFNHLDDICEILRSFKNEFDFI